MYIQRYIELFYRLTILLGVYTFCRILFFIVNKDFFREATMGNVYNAFFYGIRFDASIIFSSNLVFILLSLLPFAFMESKNGKLVLKILFGIVNIPLIFMNMADVEFFRFTLRRTGYDILGMVGDVHHQTIQLALNYWYILVIFLLLSWVLMEFYALNKVFSIKKITKQIAWVYLLIVIGVSIVIIRGGFQYKPIKSDNAFVLSPNVLGNLVLNTPYNFFTTFSYPKVEKITYFDSDDDAVNIIRNTDKKKYLQLNNKQNVVVIILESFAREYMGYKNPWKGYTPFLDSLAGKSVFFDNHFANGRRSIDAVPALFASIPNLRDEAFTMGIYQTNEVRGIATYLNKYGYHTSFFHGGKNGTMGFDQFAKNAGFMEYYGYNEYPNKDLDYDGNWGIYDEPYLDYFCQKVSTFKQPFFTSVFTLSSHQPYSLPEKYKGKFPKGSIEVQETIGYADYALKKFFEKASKQPWYSNTLFVLLADHTASLNTNKYNNDIGAFKVPMILFHPQKQINIRSHQVSQHIDVMPTILDYLGVYNDKPILFGRSLYNHQEGKALLYINKTHYLYKGNYYISFSKSGTQLFLADDYSKQNEIKNLPEVKKTMENELKAYLQYHNNGLIKNSWYGY